MSGRQNSIQLGRSMWHRYRFSYFAISFYNCNCLCSWLPAHMMDSCAVQAMCGGHHQFFFHLFLRVHNWNSTRGKPCEHFCTRRVSLRYRFGYRFGTGENVEKGTILSFACKHEWTNCISRYCKVSLLVVHHIAFHCLEPLSRKKSASQEDSYMKSLAGFSYDSYLFQCDLP